MKFRSTRPAPWPLALGAVASAAGAGPAIASSTFIQGRFVEAGVPGHPYRGPGVCAFVTGARSGLAADQFVLTAGEPANPDSAQLRLTGTFSTAFKNGQVFTLSPDEAATAAYVQGVLRKQLADDSVSFHIDSLAAGVRVAATPERLLCDVTITGELRGAGVPTTTPVIMSFASAGLYDPGYTPPPGIAGASRQVPNCPTSTPQNQALAPLGLAPIQAQCGTAQCLVSFKTYQWWTSFQYYGPQGGFFPNGGYFYNGGLQTTFAPKNAFVDAAGLHLTIATRDLGGGPTTAGAEVVLMFNGDGSAANLGYGDYLVTATTRSASSWATLDPNTSFGVFTFERIGKGDSGPVTNPHRELDLAELSRWGWDHTGTCPFNGSSLPLCQGNAQFTLQPWESSPKNLHRYMIKDGVATVTLVMSWHGANQPVTFRQFDGAYSFATLPATATYAWTTAADQNQFVPATNCERFHLNFWLGNYTARQIPNPPPRTLPQEILVTNFEFRPPA